MPDEYGNETPAERRAREKKERQERIDFVNEQERIRRQQKQEEAAMEAIINEMDTEELEDFFRKEIGIDPLELRYELEEGLRLNPNDKDIQQALDAIKKGQKAANGGLFSSGDSRKAKRILNSKKGVIKKAHQKSKKKGCLGAFLVLTGVGGGILYGLYEAGAAIVSAMQ